MKVSTSEVTYLVGINIVFRIAWLKHAQYCWENWGKKAFIFPIFLYLQKQRKINTNLCYLKSNILFKIFYRFRQSPLTLFVSLCKINPVILRGGLLKRRSRSDWANPILHRPYFEEYQTVFLEMYTGDNGGNLANDPKEKGHTPRKYTWVKNAIFSHLNDLFLTMTQSCVAQNERKNMLTQRYFP